MHRFLSLCVVLASIVGLVCGQPGGYVVRGRANVINGHTIRIDDVDVTLSGVDPVDGYDSSAAKSLKRRIGKSDVGCMVDGNWCVLLTCERRTVRPSLALPPPLTRSQAWQELGYCGDSKKGRTRDVMKTLNAYVVAMGWAKSDRSWNLFNSLESKAQKQKKGMWRKY